MSETPTVDLDTMDLAALRVLADAELAANPETPTEPLRDEAGRFVAPPAEVEEALVAVPLAAEPPLTMHEVKIITASREQVFRAETKDALIAKLVTAQENSTRELEKRSAERKADQAMSGDERYAYQQRLQSEPDVVLAEERAKIKAEILSDPDIQESKAAGFERRKEAVATAWVKSTPEFYANEANGQRMYKEMALNGVTGVPTTQDIESAYRSLKAAGVLQEKPAEAPPAAVPVVTPIRRTSTLSTRSTAVNAPNTSAPKQPTEQELYDMPLEKLRELGGGGTSRW